MNIKDEIIKFCLEMGLSEIGFCKCEGFDDLESYLTNRKKNDLQNEFEGDNIYIRTNPNYYLKDGKTIISIAFPYFYKFSEEEEIYFSIYTRGKDYHKVVSGYLSKLCSFIQTLGGMAKYFVDSNALPERYIAEKCGIGFTGKNNMIINKQYGSYLFLGEVITDLYIEPSKPSVNKCGNCEVCLSSCPTKSINKGQTNPNICLSYITQKKHIDEIWFSKLEGRIFGCDSCQKVCPFNGDVEESCIKDFEPFKFMKKVNIEEVLNLNNKIFNEKYKLTSAGWRGKNIIKRNALINIFANGKKELIYNINMESPYIMDYYNRLLEYFK